MDEDDRWKKLDAYEASQGESEQGDAARDELDALEGDAAEEWYEWRKEESDGR